MWIKAELIKNMYFSPLKGATPLNILSRTIQQMTVQYRNIACIQLRCHTVILFLKTSRSMYCLQDHNPISDFHSEVGVGALKIPNGPWSFNTQDNTVTNAKVQY